MEAIKESYRESVGHVHFRKCGLLILCVKHAKVGLLYDEVSLHVLDMIADWTTEDIQYLRNQDCVNDKSV
ncbi:glutamate--cysteine ligase [Trifolium repens]|nr:glutamate--cysteine ligase [Trifolium repens]